MSSTPETVTAAALRARLEAEAITLLDVRREADAAASPSGIPGAAWRDPARLEEWAATLPLDRPVALYCVRGGGVSQGAAEALAARGLAVLRLEGGLEAWRAAGLPFSAITPEEVALLRQAGLPEDDIRHCGLVAANALWLAEGLAPEAATSLDREALRRGCAFHDLGKVKDDGVLHGVVGAELGRELGLEEAALRGMLVHVRAGVPPENAAHYGLPPGDYRPVTLEENLVIVADKLTDMVEDGFAVSQEDAWSRFGEILGAHPSLGKDAATAARYLALAGEIAAMRK